MSKSNRVRIGFGYDAHRFEEGRPLIIGGIKVPHRFGLKGHSDADVLTHAIIDALLGSLAKGDIGRHFPDTDPAYKGADSLKMLKKTGAWVSEAGFIIENIDTTIVAEEPKLAPYVTAMEKKLADVLGIGRDQINIKAKTTEGMGFCGRKEGLAAYAVAALAEV